MEDIILKAMPRTEKPKKVRTAGLIPGVLNGPGTLSTSVEFENVPLNKIITRHGTNAKLWVMFNDEKKFGFIKEVQRHPVEGKIIHVAIQMVSKDQDVKMQLPINYDGHSELENRLLQLQVYKPEIEVEGKAVLMPDEAVADVSKKVAGDSITAADFTLPKGIKILDAKTEVYAVIKNVKEEVVEEPKAATEPAEVKPAE